MAVRRAARCTGTHPHPRVTLPTELNWGKVFAPLARHFRVVAMDLRGHGDGIRVGWRFKLEDCADDVAALADVLAIDSFVAVGYVMGGTCSWLVPSVASCLRELAVPDP
jgi:pimeloyl-ACP methyl ester carboxylesterase